jgi:SSS family solute:Na+ symporter
LLIGWLVGMALGTYMAFLQSSPATPHFASSTYSLHLFGQVIPGYAAFYAVIVNIVVTVVLSLIFNLAHVSQGTDRTTAVDYQAADVVAVPAGA